MLNLNKLKQSILELIQDACIRLLVTLPNSNQNSSWDTVSIYTKLKNDTLRAIESSKIVVSRYSSTIYLADADEHLYLLPLIPMLYTWMLHSTYTVVADGGKTLGTVKYGGEVDETVPTDKFGVDTEFTFEKPLESIYVEVTIE